MSAPALAQRPPQSYVTADQLLAMDGDGIRRELVGGVVREMSPAGLVHGRIAMRLALRIGNHVESAALGLVVAAETGFRIARDPDTVRAPDVAFIAAGRAGALSDEQGFPNLAPDFAVDVVGPSDRAGDVLAKVLSWIEAGVSLVWVVYPGQRMIVVHLADGSLTQRHAGEVLEGGDVVPGLTIAVDDVFA